ncbi:MAG: hypothetical protein ACT4PK_11510 [Gammaproteobacteria bacterium]
MAVRPGALPNHALLQAYAREGHYTDCWTTEIAATISHAQYVSAFYTTWVFKLERWILSWAVSRPSTNDEAAQLGAGMLERFSAWKVEARADHQLLMADEFTRRTRSWLMVEPLAGGGTRLYFGSAVVREHDGRMGRNFSLLLGFHRLYSRILLGAVARKLCA